MLAKVEWLAACIALKVVGGVLVVFLRCWRKICTILQPMGSNGQDLKKSTKTCSPIRSTETWIKYTPLISKPTQTRINRDKKSLEHLRTLKTGRVPYLGLELTLKAQQPNPTRETVPFIIA